MKIKQLITILLTVFWINSAYSAHSETGYFPLNAYIEKNKFFNEEVTRFEFVPNSIGLNYNNTTQTFNDETTSLVIETNIPAEDTEFAFAIRMTQAQMMCTNSLSEAIQTPDDIVSVYVTKEDSSEHLMLMDKALILNFNNEVDGNKAANYNTRLSFDTIPSNASDCSGSVMMTMEYSI